MINSTDASIFEIEPKEVIFPKNQEDLIGKIRSLLRKNQAFTMRAGGTSIGGQAIGEGVIVDVSKYLTKIISFSKESKEVIVEPGIIQDDLNNYLKPFGFKFAPDTSTSNRAMIGGMIGNNSCGAYSAYYGTTREHVKSVEILLSDGSLVIFKEVNDQALKAKLRLKTLEGDIYRFVIDTLYRGKEKIINTFPDKSIIRRNTGYAIDELIKKHKPFNQNGKNFSLAPLICGSEGTLGVVIKATLNLVELPKNKSLIVAQFKSEGRALRIVHELMSFKPAAVEFIDAPTLESSKNNVEQNANRSWIHGNPAAVLIIEFFNDNKNQLNDIVSKCKVWLKLNQSYSCSEIDFDDYKKVWGVRKAGLGLLMGNPGPRKALAVIEDAALPLKYMYDYYRDVKKIINCYNIEAVYYGHASVGLIHIRPKLDLSNDKDRRVMENIAKDVSKIVKKYKGSLSGEHGDGRIRAPYLEEQFGEEVYQLLVNLKNKFDSKNLLNPGVIIGNSPITKNLKSVAQINNDIKTAYDWTADVSFFYAAEKCNGAGVCRKSSGNGVMCPSYQATRVEEYSTRGRANLLRRALNSKEPLKALNNNELRIALDLCLGCKACKSECPASVDMAKLKSEYLYQTKDQQNQFEIWRTKNLGLLLRLGSKNPKIFNFLQNLNFTKKIIKLDGHLPQIQQETLSKWWEGRDQSIDKKDQITVWVLCDIHTEFYDSQIGKDLLEFLILCKVNIKLVNLDSSIALLVSKGLLKEAKDSINKHYEILGNIPKKDIIMGIEPSEVLAWKDDCKHLKADQILSVNLPEELIIQLNKSNLLPNLKPLDLSVCIHLHCHQRSLSNEKITIDALSLIPKLKVEVLDTGCCGMAGDFGYKHRELSKIIFNNLIIKNNHIIKEHDFFVVTGSSCSSQYKKLSNSKVQNIFHIFGLAV